MNSIETYAALGAAGNKANGVGLSTTVLGWLVSNEVLALAGFLVAVGGFVITWYYKRKEFALKKKETEQRLKYEALRYKQLEDEIEEGNKRE